jgi:hypothetical protein
MVDYQQVVKLTTETGHQVFIGFRPATCAVAHHHRVDHHRLPGTGGVRPDPPLLQTESPLFFSSINLVGIRAFNLSTGAELPGEGPADDDALAQLMASIRRHVAESESLIPPSDQMLQT